MPRKSQVPPDLQRLFDAGADERDVCLKMLTDGIPAEGGNIELDTLRKLLEVAFNGGMVEGYTIHAKEEQCRQN